MLTVHLPATTADVGRIMPVQPWVTAWLLALYGPDGFFSSGRGAPGSDFRTSSTAGPAFAGALARLAVRVDEALGRPPAFDLVEVGAGRGRLLLDTAGALPADLAARTRLTAVELAPRPPELPPEVAWQPTLPAGVEGLLIANEWLDDVPCPVVETDDRGVRRVVLVGADGREEPGPAVGGADAAWLDRWWPGLAQPGARAEGRRHRAGGTEQLQTGAALNEAGVDAARRWAVGDDRSADRAGDLAPGRDDHADRVLPRARPQQLARRRDPGRRQG